MIKDFLLVSMGSCIGGGARFLVSIALQAVMPCSFPWGTLAVNVAGCFIIGALSALPSGGLVMSPSARLFLATGLCGGFTTFSTFMNETSRLLKDGQYSAVGLYVAGSVALGMRPPKNERRDAFLFNHPAYHGPLAHKVLLAYVVVKLLRTQSFC